MKPALAAPILVALTAPAALLPTLAGCSQSASDKATAPKPCCEQPKIPAGVAPFVVVADDVEGPSDGQKVKLRAGLSQPVKRDGVYKVLHILYAHTMKRGPFEPIDFVADVYGSEADARAGGDGKILARISRSQSEIAPRCDNRIKWDFGEQVERAFAHSLGRAVAEDPNDTCHLAEKKKSARFDDGFKHRATVKADPARMAAEVTHPYLDMGKDEYVGTLKRNSALRDWVEYTTTLFRNVDGLKEVTFNGVHDDEPVVRITVTSEQWNGGLSTLQETISAHAAITFQSLGMGKSNDKQAEKEQETFKAKTYKTAIALLPKGQVSISPQLK